MKLTLLKRAAVLIFIVTSFVLGGCVPVNHAAARREGEATVAQSNKDLCNKLEAHRKLVLEKPISDPNREAELDVWNKALAGRRCKN